MSYPQENRKIIHIDMDAFYASIEQRDRPNIRNKPVVVGGDPNSRGVVASASYEARKYGIRSAMSCSQAYRLCPSTVFVYPNFEKYLLANRKLMEIFQSVTILVEPLALDEAYLDVSVNHLNESDPVKIVKYIKSRIFEEVGITASAGIGPNKFIAKLASKLEKPDGLVNVKANEAFRFVENLPVEDFWGIGPATAKKLHSFGIRTARDIRKRTVSELEKVVGSYGSFLFELAHGEDNREVDPTSDPKSTGTETTFEKDISDPFYLVEMMRGQSLEVSEGLKSLQRRGRTVVVKIKYADFSLITRSRTLSRPTDDSKVISEIASELLLKEAEINEKPVRLIGVSVTNLVSQDEPIQLWFEF